ncbi:MAG TPA: MotA/TolQ/ExbB proton channel family protein [Planctomycetota bacterium]|nr:MotA/TolQ/ExbB proton channel family protein [Planctomycetota bacterium]
MLSVFDLQSALAEQPLELWEHAARIWRDGGWAMLGIAIDAMLMFGLGMHVWLRLRAKRFCSVPEKTWRLWLKYAQHREGPIGRLLDKVSDATTLDESAAAFRGLRSTEVAPFDRDLKVMRVCVAVGPLLGLFGTVTGMLVTFSALASGSGGEKTMSAIAKGISEALITTETGLVVALPGLFFQYQLRRTKERYSAFLAHLETVSTQLLYRRLRTKAVA